MNPRFQTQVTVAVAVIAAALLTVGCGGNPDQIGWWQGEQQRIELAHQLELKQFRFEQSYSRDFEQLERLRQSTKEAASSLKSLRQQRLALGDEVESLQGQWAGFRESTIRKQRQQAMGKTFDKFGTVAGRLFVEVTVASIDDSGVTIRHADGSARLRFADLDAEQRVFFGLEADLALAAEEKESRDAAAYDRWVEKRMVAIDERKLKDSESARREELADQRARTALAAQLVAASNARPLAQPATNVGSRSWSYSNTYSSYRAYRPTYRYVYYDTNPCYNNSYRPAVSVYPSRTITPYCHTPPAVPRRQSFANTTLPYIP